MDWPYRPGIRYNLEAFQKALHACGNPHKNLPPIIHVAGTNGKGSTVAFISNALQHLGYRVGVYTSPHLLSYTERLTIQNHPISKETFDALFQRFLHIAKDCALTEFEYLTLLAFDYFREAQLDAVILETGLGGRLDATNVVTPTVSVITSIGFDHQDILGDVLEKIALEKAGIIKHRVPVVTCHQVPSVMKIISSVCQEHESPLFLSSPLLSLPLSFQLNAAYQKENAGLAFTAIQTFLSLRNKKSNKKAIMKGFEKTFVWGRMTKYQRNGQEFIFDAAHNPMGIQALLHALTCSYPQNEPAFIVGILKRKDAAAMMAGFPEKSRIYYCDFSPPETHTFFEIRSLMPSFNILPYMLQSPPVFPPHRLLVITGSFYFISKFKPYFS